MGDVLGGGVMQSMKFVWMSAVAIAASGCAIKIGGEEQFMTNAMATWVGASFDEVTNYWGYPDEKQDFEGRVVYSWRRDTTLRTPAVTTAQAVGGQATAITSGGGTLAFSCTRYLEVADGIVVKAAWKGNDCPNGTGGQFKYWVRPKAGTTGSEG